MVVVEGARKTPCSYMSSSGTTTIKCPPGLRIRNQLAKAISDFSCVQDNGRVDEVKLRIRTGRH